MKSTIPSTTSPTDRHWFGVFDDTFTPVSTMTSASATPANSYPFQARTASTAYVADFFRSAVGSASPPTVTQSTPCLPTGRYTTGSLTGFGVGNALGQLDAVGSVLRRAGSTNESPGRSGTTLLCRPDFPCDVTLESQLVPPTPEFICTYRIGARRYDFSQPSAASCEYFAVRSSLSSSVPRYTYEYLTKGTELIGRGTLAGLDGGLCGSP